MPVIRRELIRRTIKSQEEDPRMPALLEDEAWSTLLREDSAAGAKAVLKTMDGVSGEGRVARRSCQILTFIFGATAA